MLATLTRYDEAAGEEREVRVAFDYEVCPGSCGARSRFGVPVEPDYGDAVEIEDVRDAGSGETVGVTDEERAELARMAWEHFEDSLRP